MKYFAGSPYRIIEKKLGYSFRRKKLIATALMHRSFRFETPDAPDDNQRLEFLGDAVLSLVSTEYLFRQFPGLDEGPLTSLRVRLASDKALAKVARSINLGEHLKLGKGERESGGHERESNVADAMEAILGAAYIDGGLKAVNRIFKKIFLPMIEAGPNNDYWSDNPKGELQMIAQKRWNTNPVYKLLKQDGPSHARIFTIKVLINGKTIATAKGANKRIAEQRCAAKAVRLLRGDDQSG